MGGHGVVWGTLWLIKKIHHLEWKVKAAHSYRDANQCSDALENLGCSLNHTRMFYVSCPTLIRNLLLADTMEITIACLISM
jgi:hypothetical protein